MRSMGESRYTCLVCEHGRVAGLGLHILTKVTGTHLLHEAIGTVLYLTLGAGPAHWRERNGFWGAWGRWRLKCYCWCQLLTDQLHSLAEPLPPSLVNSVAAMTMVGTACLGKIQSSPGTEAMVLLFNKHSLLTFPSLTPQPQSVVIPTERKRVPRVVPLGGAHSCRASKTRAEPESVTSRLALLVGMFVGSGRWLHG